MKSPLRILMTACGAPGAPGILKCLRNNGEREIFVYGVDMDPNAVGFAMVDDRQVCRPGLSEGYAEEILEIAKRERLQVVLPLSTMELDALSNAKGAFEEAGSKVLVSDAEGLSIANNKAKLMAAAKGCGVAVPESYRVTSIEAFEQTVKRLGFPDRPVCFKPEFGKGSRGFLILDSTHDKFKALFDQKPASAHMSLEEAVSVLGQRESIPPLLVMEYLLGDEYSVDVLCDKGESLVVVPRVRTKIKLGICFTGRTEKHEKLIEFSKTLIRQLSLNYCINLQFKVGADGIPKLLEINPRVSGTIILCAGAGVNLPYLAIKLAVAEPLGEITPSWGVRMVRYWDEVFYDERGRPFAIPGKLDRLHRG